MGWFPQSRSSAPRIVAGIVLVDKSLSIIFTLGLSHRVHFSGEADYLLCIILAFGPADRVRLYRHTISLYPPFLLSDCRIESTFRAQRTVHCAYDLPLARRIESGCTGTQNHAENNRNDKLYAVVSRLENGKHTIISVFKQFLCMTRLCMPKVNGP